MAGTPLGRQSARSTLARAGFADIDRARGAIDELAGLLGVGIDDIVAGASLAADPDVAVLALDELARRDADAVRRAMSDDRSRRIAWRLAGASSGLGEFLQRHPELLDEAVAVPARLPSADEMRGVLRESIGGDGVVAAIRGEEAWNALRVAYRRVLARIAAYDLSSSDPVEAIGRVGAALADAAAAALDASLAVARAGLLDDTTGSSSFGDDEVRETRLAIIGMGKAGALELNYVSDVDVIFVAEATDGSDLDDVRLIDIATRLAVQTMRGVTSFETEPPLWEVDPNLRPEGKQGALVRTLASHEAYYERWARSWEFQALIKARPLAGDLELGEAYVDAVRPLVWRSSERDGFVDSVQAMRERVSDSIAADELDRQLKLGPGGLRDIEFTVQLLQLVHGRDDEGVRARSTLEALEQLVARGYIGRADGAAFSTDYRLLRLMEHRLQLQSLRRTHLMPADDEERRVLARAMGLFDASASHAGGSARDITTLWSRVRQEVRDIHVRLFYRPLLSAVAETPEDVGALTGEGAHDRLAAIGFRDPKGALRHIGALTKGVSRKTTVQRTLLPVLLRWFADGVDPDYGLVAYRRISERLGDSPWFLRMLRDSAGAAEQLTRVLSGSRYVGELMEWIPESVAWLDSDEQLRPRSIEVLDHEGRAIQRRRATLDDAMAAIRTIRRRELLRTALGAVLGTLAIKEVTQALTNIADVTLQAMLRAVRRAVVPEEHKQLEFAIIGMGRYGGAEIGFGSDADVLFVYRTAGLDPRLAERYAREIVSTLRAVSEDHRAPLELDADLRPEGRKGPIVRSLDAYRAYYGRWSVSWEAQALLRARPVAGTPTLRDDFMLMVDDVRYPARSDPQDVREIKRIKARVENERIPRGVDPARHLKLGPGGLSDVEWLVQLLQLIHAHEVPELRTPRTLHALKAAFDAGLLERDDAHRLGAAWRLATRLRSANTLMTGRTSDLLPTEARDLDGVGRILGMPPGSSALVEEEWLRAARRARRSYEATFYDL